LVLGRTGLPAVPVAENARHRWTARAAIGKFERIQMIVPGAPPYTARALARRFLQRFGYPRPYVEFLLPQQRIGAQVRELFGIRDDELHSRAPPLRFRNSTMAAARSAPRSSCRKWRARSNVTGPSACGRYSFMRAAKSIGKTSSSGAQSSSTGVEASSGK